MAAIVRVKRKNSERPQEALLVACKRQKEDEKTSPDDSLTTVLKFAGTVGNQEEDPVKHVTNTLRTLSKDELERNYKQHVVDITAKNRIVAKQKSAENRYKVVSYFRSLSEFKNEGSDENVTTVIDVEDSGSNNTHNEEESDFVYDLYFTETREDLVFDQYISVSCVQEDLFCDGYRSNNLGNDSNCEDSDSNSESNWRNDYPDSDHSKNSINEDDMVMAVQNLKLPGEESDLSSEEDFVYDQNKSETNYVNDEKANESEEELAYGLDEDDVERYGHKYAKFKAKMKKEMCSDNDDGDNEKGESSEGETSGTDDKSVSESDD